MPSFTAAFLRSHVARLLAALDTPDDLAELVAGSLVAANLAGHDSHGVGLMPEYAQLVRDGRVKPAERASVEEPSGMLATLAVDGAMGWGAPAAFLATEQVVARARQYGVAAAVIRRCQHIGRVGQYVERIAAQRLIGIVTCNSSSGVAPFGGRGRVLGTNPIAIAVPREGDRAPVMFDGSTSAVAGNKLRVFAEKGLPVPDGWVMDGDGRASTDPTSFFTGGALLTTGGYKGYGLSVMVELLAGLLAGTSASFLPDFAGGNGVLVMAIRPDAFVPLERYLAQVERACAALRATPSRDGASAVLLPGEPEQMARLERTANGIPLADTAWQLLHDLSNSLGVAVG
jgi:LDH2 family malate/lactate/ureidoglycolate dehydrogenase